MAVSRLEVAHVRCIEAARLDLDNRCNLIFGANGAGKTSILEAAHVLGRGHSFRVRDNRRLIQRGEEAFRVRCDFAPGKRPGRIGVEYRHGALDVRIDGVGGRRASQLAQALPVEVIDPSAHRLIDGSPGERRRFLDWGLFHVEQSYVTAWQAYRRVLLQRNQALRTRSTDSELDVWDDAFVVAAMDLDRIREAFVSRWGRQVAAIGSKLLGSAPVVSYRQGVPQGRALPQWLRECRQRELERGLTMVGPHRSDLIVKLHGGTAREVASRGQQKLLAATLILGRLVDRIEAGHDGGLLLVDDPVAELDENSLASLTGVLSELPVQMLVTAIRGEAMTGLGTARTFHVEQGVIKPV